MCYDSMVWSTCTVNSAPNTRHGQQQGTTSYNKSYLLQHF